MEASESDHYAAAKHYLAKAWEALSTTEITDDRAKSRANEAMIRRASAEALVGILAELRAIRETLSQK